MGTTRKLRVISGASGIGKTRLAQDTSWNAIDLEPMLFRWGDNRSTCLTGVVQTSGWPDNYCDAIIMHASLGKLVLTSAHPEIINELVQRGIDVALVYPDESQAEEYRQRYINRGNKGQTLELLTSNFDLWITNARAQLGCRHFVLQPGQYLSDVLPQILAE